MAFKVPKSGRDKQRFEFELDVDGGKTETYSLPLLQFVPVEAGEYFERGMEIHAVIAMLDNELARQAVRSLDTEQFKALMDAWQEESKVTPGESEASSTS